MKKEIVFYNMYGKPIAYVDDDETIFLFDGKAVAYIFDDSVYGFNGSFLGWFENGWIIARNGEHVFYTEDSFGGPIRPIKQIKPIKGIKHIKPIKNIRQIKPIKPIKALNWYNIFDESFFD